MAQGAMGKILCIVGRKDAGKTTLIERLIPELKRRGYRVATVKRPAHSFEHDIPGSDSFRHFHAGADATVLYGDEKVAFARRHAQPPTLEALAGEFLADFDLVLVEGHKSAPFPKIEVLRAAVGAEPLYHGQPEYLAIASDVPLDLPIPRLDLGDPAAIAEFIARRFPPSPRAT